MTQSRKPPDENPFVDDASVVPSTDDTQDVEHGGFVEPWTKQHEKREQTRRKSALAVLIVLFAVVFICFATDLRYQPTEAAELLFERAFKCALVPLGWLFGASVLETIVRLKGRDGPTAT